jgi:3-hydroxy-9,10-secoandrosta-1,3,5(10)-triene-9,17-dione monooxygenase
MSATADPLAQIPSPAEPQPTPAELVRRARELRPTLRDRQAECEREGRMLEETRDDLVAAGLYRVLQPRRFGGYELDLETFVRIVVELARGCPSSGWVYALTASQLHTLALFPEQAQVEVLGAEGDVIVPMTARPSALARRDEGGFLLSGYWDYASGCDVSTHHIGGFALLADGDRVAEQRWCVIPRGDYTIFDNWDTLGMRGTGSRRVIVRTNLFVPEHRTVVCEPDSALPGRSLHRNPVYRAGSLLPRLIAEVAAVAIGLARGSLDSYEALLGKKRDAGPASPLRRDLPAYRRHVARAISLIDTAEAAQTGLVAAWTEQAREAAENGVPVAEAAQTRLVMVAQEIVRLASEAVDLLFRTAGTGATRAGDPLARSFRDMSMIRTHVFLQFEQTWEQFGRLRFDGDR